MRTLCFAFLICSMLTASPQAVLDDGKLPAKQRCPELEALDYMVGRWTSEYTLRATPDSREFRGRSIAVIKWSPNGQFLITDTWELLPGVTGVVPNGWLNALSITTWDPSKSEYRITEVMYGITNMYTMTIDGKIARVQGEERIRDHVTKVEGTYERVSDIETKIRNECSVDGGPKWIFSEGTARKSTK